MGLETSVNLDYVKEKCLNNYTDCFALNVNRDTHILSAVAGQSSLTHHPPASSYLAPMCLSIIFFFFLNLIIFS